MTDIKDRWVELEIQSIRSYQHWLRDIQGEQADFGNAALHLERYANLMGALYELLGTFESDDLSKRQFMSQVWSAMYRSMGR